MSEDQLHRITTIEQLIDVATPENINTLTKDLALWLGLHVVLKGSDAASLGREFLWNDDNQPGVGKVIIRVTDHADAEPQFRDGEVAP